MRHLVSRLEYKKKTEADRWTRLRISKLFSFFAKTAPCVVFVIPFQCFDFFKYYTSCLSVVLNSLCGLLFVAKVSASEATRREVDGLFLLACGLNGPCPVSLCLTVKVAIPVLHNHVALKRNFNLIVQKSAFVRLNCYFLCWINGITLKVLLHLLFFY